MNEISDDVKNALYGIPMSVYGNPDYGDPDGRSTEDHRLIFTGSLGHFGSYSVIFGSFVVIFDYMARVKYVR